MIRFEILLPLFYNDGRPVEPEQFTATDRERLGLFGAVSTDTVRVRGKWMYKSIEYSDLLIRIRLDLEEAPENRQLVRQYKETLKERFQQLDIWITAHDIEII